MQAQTRTFQQRLEQRRLDLSTRRRPVEATSLHMRLPEEDQPKELHDQFIDNRVLNLHHQDLRLVNEALQRIERGEYGVCQECGEAIALNRLQVLPWARYCLTCQEEQQEELGAA
jgi:DnaK suppressor protein